MAYIQITTRCNMVCDHCCYRCGPEGEDMSLEVYKAALAMDDETVSIGGGEPTLHPQFWEFIGLALGHCDYVWLATNGSLKETSLALARMAKKEVLGCELSLDDFHDYDMVDPQVRIAFQALPHAIRDVTNRGERDPIRAGRFKEYSDEGEGREDCPCSEFMVKPNGDVMTCGCEDSPRLGNVLTGYEIPEDYEWGECWKHQEAGTLVSV